MPITSLKMQEVKVHELGLVDYKKAWDFQNELLSRAVDIKIANRNQEKEGMIPPQHHFILCQHPAVYTLGRSGDSANLLLDKDGLEKIGAAYYKINRGGDITFHGPGQLVGYPILDLDFFFTDIHKYVRLIEESIIRTLSEFGISGMRVEGASGVWLEETDRLPDRKICAIGVHLRRWITMHGFALNINTNLDYFNHIVPCGIHDKEVTSMKKELGVEVDMRKVTERVLFHFGEVFGFKSV